jgi:hypothetical protein
MNKLKTKIRKKRHIDYVQNYVDTLYASIFKSALNGIIEPNKNKLFKKYNRYLELLKF